MRKEYRRLRRYLMNGYKGCNKEILIDLLASKNTSKLIKFESRDERDRKYQCFTKLVRRVEASDIIDVICRNDYVLLVKTLDY